MNNPFRLGIPGSGQGYYFVAMTEAGASGKTPAQVSRVLNDVEGAGIPGQTAEMAF